MTGRVMTSAGSKKRQLKDALAKKPTGSVESAPKPSQKGLVGLLLTPLKIFGFLVPSYFKNSFRELKQVTWPSRRETMRLTLAVFAFAIIFGALITVTDYGLDQLFKKVLLK